MKLSELIAEENRIVLLDGAMGTQLAASGVPMGGQTNISYPDAVRSVHQRYADIGIDLIITNTLTMNRVSIETHKIGVDVKEVNVIGVNLAKEAAGKEQFILGDIGSTGKLLKPNGVLTEEEAYDSFIEQATLLAENGVDGFIVETMIDLKEAVCALRACRKVSEVLPVIVSMSYETADKGGRTIMGNTAADCAKALTGEGASVVGANCGSVDPYQMAEIVAMMRQETSIPIIAQPNAGRPKVVNGETVFDMTPEDFALGVGKCIEAGAKLVGGCCGTSPAHIQAVADLLKR